VSSPLEIENTQIQNCHYFGSFAVHNGQHDKTSPGGVGIDLFVKITSITIFVFLFAAGCTDAGRNPEQKPGNLSAPPQFTPPLIENYPPVPSPAQLAWENAGLAMFVHFGMNTMTDQELGSGRESPMVFNPDRLDASQWVKVAEKSGFKSLILTAKHLDGFCLWPSRYTDYSVRNSPFRGGHGDVVREFADACHQAGLKLGFYLSPADRHEVTFGSPEYNSYYARQLTELLTEYGDVAEVWFDGANGEKYTGKRQEYDWNLFFATVRRYQPQALIACFGPDIRWAGNENGTGSVTEWSPQPSFMNLSGDGGVLTWYPSECDVSIRPGWFYHEKEDGLVKGVPQLVDIFMQSVGRNSNLLLNVPPDRHGLFSSADVSTLMSWRTTLNSMFGTDLLLRQFIQSSNTRGNREEFSPRNCVDDDESSFWTTDEGVHSAQLTVDLGGVHTVNAIRLEEAIQYGQRISSFTLYADEGGEWVPITQGTTVGRTRILTFAPVTTVQLRLSIDDAKASPTLRTFSAYSILR